MFVLYTYVRRQKNDVINLIITHIHTTQHVIIGGCLDFGIHKQRKWTFIISSRSDQGVSRVCLFTWWCLIKQRFFETFVNTWNLETFSRSFMFITLKLYTWTDRIENIPYLVSKYIIFNVVITTTLHEHAFIVRTCSSWHNHSNICIF